MRKLTSSEIKVLETLIHVESLDTIISETGLKYGEVRDDLTNLISKRFVEVFEKPSDGGAIRRTSFYDLDNLSQYYFRASKNGQLAIKGA